MTRPRDYLTEARRIRDAALQEQRDAILTLRQAAALTGEPLGRLQEWAWRKHRVIPAVHIGPTRRIGVRLSTLAQWYHLDG